MAIGCVVALVVLLAVMGVSRMQAGTDRLPEVTLAPRPAAPAVEPPKPVVRKPAEHSRLKELRKVMIDVQRTAESLRVMARGPAFENTRVDALAKLSEARRSLGAYLDEHPDDDRGHRLWDRLQGMYITLKKF